MLLPCSDHRPGLSGLETQDAGSRGSGWSCQHSAWDPNSCRVVPGLQGCLCTGVWMSSPLCHSCASVPCPVLFCVRSVGARQGCRGTSGGPRLVLSAVTGCRWAGTRAPVRVATVCPAPARRDFSTRPLRPHVPPSACWLGYLQSRGVGWKGSRDKLLSPFRSQSPAGPSPGSAAGRPGESDLASLGLALLTFRSRTQCVAGRPSRAEPGYGAFSAPGSHISVPACNL